MHKVKSETLKTLNKFHCSKFCYGICCNNFVQITPHPSMVNLCCFQEMFSVKMRYAVIISVLLAHADCCK